MWDSARGRLCQATGSCDVDKQARKPHACLGLDWQLEPAVPSHHVQSQPCPGPPHEGDLLVVICAGRLHGLCANRHAWRGSRHGLYRSASSCGTTQRTRLATSPKPITLQSRTTMSTGPCKALLLCCAKSSPLYGQLALNALRTRLWEPTEWAGAGGSMG